MLRLYVINLERSPERLERICAQFSQAGLSFTRIEAVDGRTLSETHYQAVQSRNVWQHSLTRGEVACFLSHAKALEQLIADNVAYGVIFEDDVTLEADAGRLLRSSDWLDNAGNRIDIVKLETSGKKVWLGQGISLGSQGFSAFELAKLKSTHIMAAAYLISRDSAIKLREIMQQKSAPFDHLLFNFSLNIAQGFFLYQLDPAIVVQQQLPSTLEGERAINRQELRNQRSVCQTLMREMRRLIRRTGTGLWGLKTNLFTRDQWKRIPFKN